MDGGAFEERAATVAEHLEGRYGVRVTGTSRLDLDVFRVDLAGSSPWVARIFHARRPRQAVEGDAAILRALETAGFPAERCATPDPVSDLDGETVLVTGFVEGTRPREARTFATLGSLLGRLHEATSTTVSEAAARPGGAWHHVAPAGGLDAELEGAEALLRDLEKRLPPRDRARAATLRGHLRDIDLAGLPEALLHPDCAPPNVILTPEDRHVLVDWAGAGRGPRIWSLGFLLYATGGRVRLVDLVVSYYTRHVTLTQDELDHLEEAIFERALVLDVWSAAHRDRPLAQVEVEVDATRGLARRIAAQVRALPAPAHRPVPDSPPILQRRGVVAVPRSVSGGDLPLSALLSQAWVAWTIELDNAYEAVAPHRTTREPGGRGPWLISSVMWWNCLRHLAAAEGPLTAADLASRSRLHTNLDGMERWGYLRITRPRADQGTWILSLSPSGRPAAAIFEPLPAEIDGRWAARFTETGRLRDALIALVGDLDPALPDCLPIVGPARGFLTPSPAGPAPRPAEDVRALPLGALLARALLAHTLEAEAGARAGLPFREDLLRLLDERWLQVRELPARSGVSKEALEMALGILQRAELGEVGEDPQGSRFKVVRLTPRGVRLRGAHAARLREVDAAWAPRVADLRGALQGVVASDRMREGLQAPAGGWRAKLPPPKTLPHYPMVLHRGGYPDGS